MAGFAQRFTEKGREIGHEEGHREGRKEGMQLGEARILTALLRLRFGELPAAVH